MRADASLQLSDLSTCTLFSPGHSLSCVVRQSNRQNPIFPIGKISHSINVQSMQYHNLIRASMNKTMSIRLQFTSYLSDEWKRRKWEANIGLLNENTENTVLFANISECRALFCMFSFNCFLKIVDFSIYSEYNCWPNSIEPQRNIFWAHANTHTQTHARAHPCTCNCLFPCHCCWHFIYSIYANDILHFISLGVALSCSVLHNCAIFMWPSHITHAYNIIYIM